MNEQLLQAVEVLVKTKKVPESIVFSALESVFLTAYKREKNSNENISVSIDRQTGDYHIYAEKRVVDNAGDVPGDSTFVISVEEAKKINPAYEAGDILHVDVTPKDFGRTAAQAAKQVLIQKLREAERGVIYDEFSGREGDIITGTVKWMDARTVYVDLGRVEGILPLPEQIEGETFEKGQQIKCCVQEVRKTTKGPEIILSRTNASLLKRLFELQVPEIYSGTVEIKSVSREAGSRAKIAVYAMDPTVDAVGACVGPKGQRVQNIVNELHGEKIDIVCWDEDPAVYIANALSPAKVITVAVSEEEKASYVIVEDYQLSLAIGKAGQNARLAARLTGWKIDIKSQTQAIEEGMMEPEPEEDSILGDIEAEGAEE